jgi:hypothetical protein
MSTHFQIATGHKGKIVLALEILSECEFSVITGQKMKSKSLTPINIQGHSPTARL